METFFKIIFTIINWSGIIGGIWLLCLGEWKLVLWSIFFLYLSKYIIAPLVLIPAIPAILISKFGIKSKLITRLLMPICVVGHPLAVALYGTLVIYLFYNRYLGHVPVDPLWFLVIGLGTAPWNWFARKENEENGYISAFITEFVFFLTCCVLLLLEPNLYFVFLMLFVGQLLHPIVIFLGGRKQITSSNKGAMSKQKQAKNVTQKSKYLSTVKDFLHDLFAIVLTLSFIVFIVFSIVYLSTKHNLKNDTCDITNKTFWENSKNDKVSYAKLKTCISKQANIDIPLDEVNNTPLTYATGFCMPAELIETIIKSKANVNYKNKIGWTPLLSAAYNCNNEEVVKLLLESGADTKAEIYNDSALHLALKYNSNNKIAELLLSHGSSPYSSSGINPVVLAMGNKELIAILQKYGVDIDKPEKKDCYSSLSNVQTEEDALNGIKNCTPLMVLSMSPRIPPEDISNGIQSLIDSGANTEITDSYGWTALSLAVVADNLPALEVLIKNGANVNVHNKLGMSPIMYAVSHENVRIFEELLKKKPNISHKNEKGKIIGLELDVFGISLCGYISRIEDTKIRNYFMRRMQEEYPKEFTCNK